LADIRNDGFMNTVIGHGLKNKDPLANFQYGNGPILQDQDLANLYGNALVRRIIDLPADESVKNWIKIEGDDEDEKVLQALDDLHAEESFANALRWSRLFGGSAILMTINDGGTFEDPINESSITEIEQIKVYDKREVLFESLLFNDDPMRKSYGMPEWLLISPVRGTQFYVHRSRVLIFDGDPLPNREREQRNGWGLSVMQGLFDAIRNNDHSYALAILILERMGQSVTKFNGLLDKLMTDEGNKQIADRLHLIDMARSVLNTVALDTEDEFELFNMNLSNVPEMLDRFGLNVSSLTGIPFTVLFGRSPAGMNATGESDNEIFYSMVKRQQKRKLKGNLDRLTKLQQLAKRGPSGGRELKNWCIEFLPLWMPSAKEKAETEKLEAEAKKLKAEEAEIYVGINALDGSEVRKKLADGDDYEIDETLDMLGEGDNEQADPAKEETQVPVVDRKGLPKNPTGSGKVPG